VRPATLSEACERIRLGEPPEKAFAEVLDVFYGAPGPEGRLRVLAEEPPFTGDEPLDAFVGAAAEYLARQYRLGAVPAWTAGPRRRLREPWFTTSVDSPGLREFLTFSSPAEFASRNIFTEERPLRRASQVIAD
jgi:hypothetical protein